MCSVANSADSRRLLLSKFIYPFVVAVGFVEEGDSESEGGRSSKLNKSTSAPVCIIARSSVRAVRPPPPPYMYSVRTALASPLIRREATRETCPSKHQAKSPVKLFYLQRSCKSLCGERIPTSTAALRG